MPVSVTFSDRLVQGISAVDVSPLRSFGIAFGCLEPTLYLIYRRTEQNEARKSKESGRWWLWIFLFSAIFVECHAVCLLSRIKNKFLLMLVLMLFLNMLFSDGWRWCGVAVEMVNTTTGKWIYSYQSKCIIQIRQAWHIYTYVNMW